MTSVDSNFNFQCGRPHGAGPPPPVHMRPPEPDPPYPLRVDVINGWPLIGTNGSDLVADNWKKRMTLTSLMRNRNCCSRWKAYFTPDGLKNTMNSTQP